MEISKLNVFNFLNKSQKTTVPLVLLCPTFPYMFGEEGVKVFILKNCWSRLLVRNLLPVKPTKRLVKPCWKTS